ncbi:phosphate signaling complex protein PhoU [Planomicrobium sp. YIM 101495]|uniref:phosphate signaling complex protein PhoU n=1 Tax=Planomicrobium sp. YIM 101495 TaxID=2665160 RepID=UPI0012B97A33|nr:phosphate signaling complex protein PhoU [Planomicrobium sp. YIM 101495]MTD29960.1 phosphate signaling complex protein PhoU [Planomicrobium sp. YIM 101495]
MSIRERFDLELNETQEQLIEMSDYAIAALNRSMDALMNHDIDTALEIIEDDAALNRMEEEINQHVILMIAKQSPVATDLRRLVVTLKVAADLERVGDYAVNIAKETIRIGKQEHLPPITLLQEMHEMASKMLHQVIEAFIAEDIIKAKEIAEIDDQVDDLYGQAIRQLMRSGAEDPERMNQVTQLAFICRYLERSADYATNIAEQLFYLVRGKRYDLNS